MVTGQRAPQKGPEMSSMEEAVKAGHEAGYAVDLAAAACGNSWHRSAPARMRQSCPECPSEIRTAVLAKFGVNESEMRASGILTIHRSDDGTHYTWIMSGRDGIRTQGRADAAGPVWKVLTDAEYASAQERSAARLKTQHALEKARHERIQRELGLVRALIKATHGIPAWENVEADDSGEGWFAWGYEGAERALWGTVADGPDGWEVKLDPDCL